MSAVEKLVHRYWVDVLGCSGDLGHHPCKVSDAHPSFLHIDSWQKVLKKQILPYYGAAKWALWKNCP